MDKVTLSIDGKQIEARPGTKVLWAALDNGIYIPNLCAIRDVQPFAACRLCFVDIEGKPDPVTACTETIAEGMRVYTNTSRVNRLRRTAFELLIASHTLNCKECGKNRHCELQKIAHYLRVKLKPQRFRQMPRSLPIDSTSPIFIFDPNKCVLCGKCVWVCNKHHAVGAINFIFRGFDTRIGTFGDDPIAQSSCDSCGECVAICPVGALIAKAN